MHLRVHSSFNALLLYDFHRMRMIMAVHGAIVAPRAGLLQCTVNTGRLLQRKVNTLSMAHNYGKSCLLYVSTVYICVHAHSAVDGAWSLVLAHELRTHTISWFTAVHIHSYIHPEAFILQALSTPRQQCLCTATVSHDTRISAHEYLRKVRYRACMVLQATTGGAVCPCPVSSA